MKLKISEKVLCIPPFISTTWDRIAFIQSEENSETRLMTLILNLNDGQIIRVPNLDPSLVDIAFAAHLRFLEQSINPKDVKLNNLFSNFNPEQIIGIPLKFGQVGIEGLESAFQHNQAQANTPDLPQEILNKISSIAKIIANGESVSFPKPEPHCNCMHCQVARAIHGIEKESDSSSSLQEEAINEDDLKFRLWDISQSGEKLFTVTNPLDSKEQYNVYLGSPVGCTCGQENCDHIRAVLIS